MDCHIGANTGGLALSYASSIQSASPDALRSEHGQP
jgi:hypothetical protein